MRNGNVIKIQPNGTWSAVSGLKKGYQSIDVIGKKIFVPDPDADKVRVYTLEEKLMRIIKTPKLEGVDTKVARFSEPISLEEAP